MHVHAAKPALPALQQGFIGFTRYGRQRVKPVGQRGAVHIDVSQLLTQQPGHGRLALQARHQVAGAIQDHEVGVVQSHHLRHLMYQPIGHRFLTAVNIDPASHVQRVSGLRPSQQPSPRIRLGDGQARRRMMTVPVWLRR